MDESFSDFQEKKKCNTGPKNTQKAKAKCVKRKPSKKSKTQKDIRVFVKGKENELVSYSKNFSEVCKKSGLDVDSEQLQLAIALSKSLQSDSLPGHNSQEEKPLSSQERTAKIKSTLQEYGFKVPNSKNNTNKRRQHTKKKHKLLLMPDEEKKQLITEKYLKVLATDPHKSLEESYVECNSKQSELYYKATNICFENIKNDEIFYVNDLGLEISHSIDLLRDWSEIPGRPLSPSIKKDNFKFDNINLSEEELDLVLSGALKTVQNIIKHNNIVQIKEVEEKMLVENIEICIVNDVEVENISEKSSNCSSSNLKNTFDTNNLSLAPSMVSVQRSVSPDIFDDDDITIIDQSFSTKTNEINFDKKDNQTCFMDLTECVAINICQDSNTTKRKSNDVMDITECVTSSKQMCIKKIDLTQEFVPIKYNKEGISSNKENIEVMDLTQSSNSDEETEKVDSKENDSSDETIIIYDNVNKENICERSDNEKEIQSIDIDNEVQNDSLLNRIESSDTVLKETEEAIPIEEKYNSPTYTYTDHVFDHSFIYDYDNFDDNSEDIGNKSSSDGGYHVTENITRDSSHNSINRDIICPENSDLNKKSLLADSNTSDKTKDQEKVAAENDNLSSIKDNELSTNFNEAHKDLQKSLSDTDKKDEITYTSKEIDTENTKNESEDIHISNNLLNNGDENAMEASQLDEYNDYVFEHHSYVYDYDYQNSPIDKNNDDNGHEIDLTQTSDVEPMESGRKSHLGKIDNISVDYDDIICVDNLNSNNKSKSSSLVYDKEPSNCSKNSEAFEVSDKEFNYSLHQSRFDNFDGDGFDDIEKEFGNTSRSLNRSMSENDLNTKGDCKNIKSQKNSNFNITPVKALSQDVKSAIMQTPSNDYVIKTRDVTPMADYASMSSPERNEELKRYGLKPFKRKRAIQLLTYLYNQTHPVVESCDLEEHSSPAKRLKYDTPIQKSPKKSSKTFRNSKSPIKSSQSNRESVVDKENSLYMQTKELPDIKEIHCDPEDWVFQTREKSKVHSCRVPLHIAFHNYVSCRRYLRESILRYEPVNIDVIHKDLVSIGYRYNPKDLLKFMDKKCITVKTTDNNARNRK